jgi:hypothetical protein
VFAVALLEQCFHLEVTDDFAAISLSDSVLDVGSK